MLKIQPDKTKGVAMNTKEVVLRDVIVVAISTFCISVLHIEHVVHCKALIDLCLPFEHAKVFVHA